MPLFLSSMELALYFSASLIFLMISVLSAICKSKTLDAFNALQVAIMMISFYGFRAHGTPDIRMYLNFFDQMSGSDDIPWGYGFYAISSFIKYINNSHGFYVFSTSLLFVILLLIFSFTYFKSEPYKSLLMLAFFNGWYVLDLATNTIRQGIALPFVMFAFYSLVYRKYLLFILLSSLSLGIHWGTIIPLTFGIIAFFLSRRKQLLKLLTLLALVFYILSYFINLHISKIIVGSTFIEILQNIFVGLNIKGKIEAYLNHGIGGAFFYQFPVLSRLKYTIESFLPFVVNAIFFLTRKNDDPFFVRNRLYIPIYAFFLLLTVYAVSIISMVWFFRNFYWGPLLSMASLMMILSYYKHTKNHVAYVFCLALCVLIVSLLSNWPSELLLMSYPV